MKFNIEGAHELTSEERAVIDSTFGQPRRPKYGGLIRPYNERRLAGLIEALEQRVAALERQVRDNKGIEKRFQEKALRDRVHTS